jgi:hypothetical protein
MDEICDVALFSVLMSLEVQFQMQAFLAIIVDFLQSRQVQPYCFHHQGSSQVTNCWFVLKHFQSREISNKFDQQNAVQVTVCWGDDGEVLQLSVVG